MNVALLGTWHVHAPEYSEAVISSEKANLVKVWDETSRRLRLLRLNIP